MQTKGGNAYREGEPSIGTCTKKAARARGRMSPPRKENEINGRKEHENL